MTLAFLVRKGYLKVIGSVIQAALDRGHRIALLWDPDEAKPGERVTEEDLRHWPAAAPVVYRRGPLLPALQAHQAGALVAPSLHYLLRAFGREDEVPALRAAGVRLHSIDYLLETLTSDPEGYRAVETTFYASEHQRALHWQDPGFRHLGDVDLHARSAVCGSTLMDQFALVDREGVRKRYGLSPERPVVVLMSLKLAVPEPLRRLAWRDGPAVPERLRRLASRVGPLRKLNVIPALFKKLPESYRTTYGIGRARFVREVWSGGAYRHLGEALRRFALRHDAALVVKSREKNDDPRFIRGLADVFVYDEDVYPYTSIELMAVADLCVHFQSGAVLEAAFAGVPSLSVKVPPPYPPDYPAYEAVWGALPEGLQNFEGIVWSAGLEEAASRLDAVSLADFRVDPGARRRYVEKFLGFDDTRSSLRVVQRIEQNR